MKAYVGSFNYEGAEGITICDYDEKSGMIKPVEVIEPNINAGSLTISGNVLYSTDEQVLSAPGGGGKALAFAIDKDSGNLTKLSEVYTHGANTSGITIDKNGKYAIVTHFSIGIPVVKVEKNREGKLQNRLVFHDCITNLYILNEDGSIGELKDSLFHNPKGNPSFIHKAFLSPDRKFFGYGNLGSDKVGFIKINYEKECLEEVCQAKCRTDAGPRHVVFHPFINCFYVNYERNNYISKYNYHEETIIFDKDFEAISENIAFNPKNNHSEILIDTKGKHLYDVMRGLGEIYVYDIDEEGDLTKTQTIKTEAIAARGATFSPDEKYLLLAATDKECIITYRIDELGRLTEMAVSDKIMHPASIVFCKEA